MDVKLNGNILNCKNNGEVFAIGKNVGGISGSIKENVGTQITNCINIGNIIGEKENVGGIVGNAMPSTVVTNCHNKGNVKAKCNTLNNSMCGGIVGNLGGINVSITYCSNSGSIYGEGEYVGGIIGVIAKKNNETPNTIVQYCFNIGEIIGAKRVGGIIGKIAGNKGGTITHCYNRGSVTGETEVGSVACAVSNAENEHVLGHLYYLSSLNLGAINGEDIADKNITSTTKELNSFEEFKKWITQFTI